MKKFLKRIPGLLLLLMLLQPAEAHFKARYHVIVDTDGGIDDFRAICMMLASPEIEIIAITAADGVLDPELTARKVRCLLADFGHQGIPVGVGLPNRDKSRILAAYGPATDDWKGSATLAATLAWSKTETALFPVVRPGENAKPEDVAGPVAGVLSGTGTLPRAVELIGESVDLEEMPVDIVALGPLTNLAAAFMSRPELPGKIRKVYWLNGKENRDDFNYALDPSSSARVMGSGCPIDCVDPGETTLGDPGSLAASLDTLATRYAAAIRELYRNAPAGFFGHYMAGHLADDCIPLYLLYPQYFNLETIRENPEQRKAKALSSAPLAESMLEILDSDREDKSIIFSRFPVDPALFEEDVAAIAPRILEKHGLKEWKIVVLTNEFHEHLGIYSIIGAKMGLRAREYFHVGIDELRIVSFAGSQPPLSCMNDGLQVSTGATMGHGTIRLAEGETFPKARFHFKNRIIELSVKKDIREKIREDVSRGVRAYGMDSPQYWEYIRGLALKYWLDLSRYDTFDIDLLSPAEVSSDPIR